MLDIVEILYNLNIYTWPGSRLICEDGPAVVQVPALPVLVGEADRLLARRGINLGHGAVSLQWSQTGSSDLVMKTAGQAQENQPPGSGLAGPMPPPSTHVWRGEAVRW